MKRLHQYLCGHKAATLSLMWLFFAITLGYMLLCLLVMPGLPYYACLVPGSVCLYLRLVYSKAVYDPKHDKFSEQYVPRRMRG